MIIRHGLGCFCSHSTQLLIRFPRSQNILPSRHLRFFSHVMSPHHVTSPHRVTSCYNFSTNPRKSPTLVVTKLPAKKMRTLRYLQFLSHAGIIATTLSNIPCLLYSVLSDSNYLPLSNTLSLSSLILLFPPLYISCIVGRLEFNRFNKTLIFSTLNLFGKRIETTHHVTKCDISRESRYCSLPGSLLLPHVIFWRETDEEVADKISVLSEEGMREKKKAGFVKNLGDLKHGYDNMYHRAYICVVVGVCLVGTVVTAIDMRDNGVLDELLVDK